VSFVTHLNKNKAAVNEKPIYMRGEKDGIDAEIALQWNDGYAETLYSFANNINTHEGGTHLSGFRSALTRTVNSYATKNNLSKDLKESVSGEDIREGLTAVVSVKIPHPQFEGRPRPNSGTPRSRASSRRSSTTSWARISKRIRQSPGGLSARRSTPPAHAKRPGRPATWCGAKARLTAVRCPGSWLIARSATRR
jgi:DNA gyrase/topoisomerase IV subunit B